MKKGGTTFSSDQQTNIKTTAAALSNSTGPNVHLELDQEVHGSKRVSELSPQVV